jgi:hypothetical protein
MSISGWKTLSRTMITLLVDQRAGGERVVEQLRGVDHRPAGCEHAQQLEQRHDCH